MLYIGHFTFIEHNETGFRHGAFTALVMADDIDNATVRLHSLLNKKGRDTDLFDRYTFIFLEDIIEIRELPDDGFISHHIRYDGESPEYVSTSIPGMSKGFCESYRPYSQFEQGAVIEEMQIVPFMTIEKND